MLPQTFEHGGGAGLLISPLSLHLRGDFFIAPERHPDLEPPLMFLVSLVRCVAIISAKGAGLCEQMLACCSDYRFLAKLT